MNNNCRQSLRIGAMDRGFIVCGKKLLGENEICSALIRLLIVICIVK